MKTITVSYEILDEEALKERTKFCHPDATIRQRAIWALSCMFINEIDDEPRGNSLAWGMRPPVLEKFED